MKTSDIYNLQIRQSKPLASEIVERLDAMPELDAKALESLWSDYRMDNPRPYPVELPE